MNVSTIETNDLPKLVEKCSGSFLHHEHICCLINQTSQDHEGCLKYVILPQMHSYTSQLVVNYIKDRARADTVFKVWTV